jgi:hypothetical protein
MQARDPLRTGTAGKLDSKGDRFRAWASFLASDGLLLSAVFVLAAARGLRRLRLIGPAGILTAIGVSQYLVQKGNADLASRVGDATGQEEVRPASLGDQ